MREWSQIHGIRGCDVTRAYCREHIINLSGSRGNYVTPAFVHSPQQRHNPSLLILTSVTTLTQLLSNLYIYIVRHNAMRSLVSTEYPTQSDHRRIYTRFGISSLALH